MKFLIKCNRICNFKLEIESIEGPFFSPFLSFSLSCTPNLYLFLGAFYLFLQCTSKLASVIPSMMTALPSPPPTSTSTLMMISIQTHSDISDACPLRWHKWKKVMRKIYTISLIDILVFLFSSEHTLTLSLCFSSYLNLIFN